MKIADASLRELVAGVAADRPSPGAGAAAGAALALAAACAAKALRISARRAKNADLARAADAALELAGTALAEAQADCEDFPDLLLGTADAAARQALRADGLALLAAAADLRRLMAEHGGMVATQLHGDLAAARELTAAAEAITRRNLAELDAGAPAETED